MNEPIKNSWDKIASMQVRFNYHALEALQSVKTSIDDNFFDCGPI